MLRGYRNLLIDANVLIDYQQSRLSVLSLVSRYVGKVHILTILLEEVRDLGVADCELLGCKVIEPSLDQLALASEKRGKLSFQDNLCLIVAMEQSLVCVTNDVPLRKACAKSGVRVLWGLELMKLLVQKDGIQADDAIRVARKIHISNPQHISKQLVDKFATGVAKISKRKDRE